jgi:hypothetical protein
MLNTFPLSPVKIKKGGNIEIIQEQEKYKK